MINRRFDERGAVAVMIPARIGSSRLPRKVLVEICGKPMIQHVYERCVAAAIGDVFVATDNDEVANIIQSIGGKVLITDSEIPSGTDRIYAALNQVDPYGSKYEIIVNVQGDVPNISPNLLVRLVELMRNTDVDVVTPVSLMKDGGRATLPNVVKVAIAAKGPGYGRALYFSRSVIPHGEGSLFEHIGVYVYKRESLMTFVHLPQSGLERRESLEQLRALENDMVIYALLTDDCPVSVDIFDDILRAKDALLGRI